MAESIREVSRRYLHQRVAVNDGYHTGESGVVEMVRQMREPLLLVRFGPGGNCGIYKLCEVTLITSQLYFEEVDGRQTTA